MASQRYVSTSFWDDFWVQELDPSEKLLYLYLITNPLTTIAGVYQITLRRMAFDTGFTSETITRLLQRFSRDGKAHFILEEWMVIPNWTKHQKVTKISNVRKGIDAVLLAIPEEVWRNLQRLGYQYQYLEEIRRPFEDLKDTQRGKEGPSKTSNYSDFDLDLDLNLNSHSTHSPPEAVIEESQSLVAEDPECYKAIEQAFLSQNGNAFTNWGKEGKAIKEILKKARIRAPDGELAFIQSMLTRFWELKTTSRERFWQQQPFLPSALNATGIWDRVLETFREDPGGFELSDEEFDRLASEAAI